MKSQCSHNGNCICCRQADSTAIASIVRQLAEERSNASGPPPRVVLEMPQPNRLNGKWSWYACGHSYGVWHGALASQGFKVRGTSINAADGWHASAYCFWINHLLGSPCCASGAPAAHAWLPSTSEARIIALV